MNQFLKSIIAGIVATIVVTVFMMAAPMMGVPKMSPPAMLANMMGVSLTIGWVLHFMVGILFALAYSFVFQKLIPLKNLYLKGALYGVLLVIVAQVMMTMMAAPSPEGSMMLALMGKTIGHIILGIVIAVIVEQTPALTNET